MSLVALNRRNQISKILKAQDWSVYRLAQKVNELRPKDTKEIHYKTIWNIVNSNSIPPRTNYVNIMLIAEALGVRMDDLEQKEKPPLKAA